MIFPCSERRKRRACPGEERAEDATLGRREQSERVGERQREIGRAMQREWLASEEKTDRAGFDVII